MTTPIDSPPMTKNKRPAAQPNEITKIDVPPKERITDAIENADKLAESQLEIAKLFLSYGKARIARRRLQLVIDQYSQSQFAGESRQLLSSLNN